MKVRWTLNKEAKTDILYCFVQTINPFVPGASEIPPIKTDEGELLGPYLQFFCDFRLTWKKWDPNLKLAESFRIWYKIG